MSVRGIWTWGLPKSAWPFRLHGQMSSIVNITMRGVFAPPRMPPDGIEICRVARVALEEVPHQALAKLGSPLEICLLSWTIPTSSRLLLEEEGS